MSKKAYTGNNAIELLLNEENYQFGNSNWKKPKYRTNAETLITKTVIKKKNVKKVRKSVFCKIKDIENEIENEETLVLPFDEKGEKDELTHPAKDKFHELMRKQKNGELKFTHHDLEDNKSHEFIIQYLKPHEVFPADIKEAELKKESNVIYNRTDDIERNLAEFKIFDIVNDAITFEHELEEQEREYDKSEIDATTTQFIIYDRDLVKEQAVIKKALKESLDVIYDLNKRIEKLEKEKK